MRRLGRTTCARMLQRSSRVLYSSLPMQDETVRNDPASHILVSPDLCDHRGMQLCFLGTSSSIPTLKRNPSCLAVRLDGVIYLVDCGEGVQKQLNQMAFRPSSIDNIFITHMHGDHIFGLPGLLCGLGMTDNKSEPINIYGPEGLRAWIRTTLNSCYGSIPSKYAVHELKIGKKAGKGTRQVSMHQDELVGQDIYPSHDSLWHLIKGDKYIVKGGFLKHGVPCWGFIIEEQSRPGRFSVERACNLGVKPGRDYALLQKGHSITLENGQKIIPSDVLGHARRGRKLVILGDTCDSSSLLSAAAGADVLVHECTILEEDAFEAVKRFHSTATMAGKFARAIGTRCLVLTHFSCKYEGRPDLIRASVAAAQTSFRNKKVIAAMDGLAVTVRHVDEPAG